MAQRWVGLGSGGPMRGRDEKEKVLEWDTEGKIEENGMSDLPKIKDV